MAAQAFCSVAEGNLVSRTEPEQMRLERRRSQHPNSVVALVGEVDSSRLIERDTSRETDLRSRGWSAVPAEPAYSVSRNRGDEACGRVNPPYPMIDRIRDIEISVDVQRRGLGVIQCRVLSWSA